MADIAKIKPSITHHFESIGDFYICSMNVGQYLELSKSFDDVDETNSSDILEFCFSKMAYKDADCEHPLEREIIDKVTQNELVCLFDELIENGNLIHFSPDKLSDDLKKRYEEGGEEWPPELRIAFILLYGVIAPLTKRGELLLGSRRNILGSLGSPAATALGKSLAASSALGRHIESIQKFTKPLAQIGDAFKCTNAVFAESMRPPKSLLSDIDFSALRNPVLDTNEKLDEFKKQMQLIGETSIATSNVINQLNETVMAFLLDFKEAADKTNKSSGLMLKIAVGSLVLTCLLSLASLGVAIMSYRDSNMSTEEITSKTNVITEYGIDKK